MTRGSRLKTSTILLTGSPGCGKTTLVRHVLAGLNRPAGGFYTQEVRSGGGRRGFEIVTLDGQRGVLASVDIGGQPRVGKYGVDLATLEAQGVAAVRRAMAAGHLVVIDEIGPMEVLSDSFRDAVLAALDSHVPLLATIVKRSLPFTDRIKARPDVTLIEVRPDNRDGLPARILHLLQDG